MRWAVALACFSFIEATLSGGNELSVESSSPPPEVLQIDRSPVWKVPMEGGFQFGIRNADRFHETRLVPRYHKAACPTDREYCIDTRYSDAGTCMHPSPLEIKKCLDESCRILPENQAIFEEFHEDSYCKEYQSPSGRVCQWTAIPCTCASTPIRYTNAVFVTSSDVLPSSHAVAHTCQYPDKYKAVNMRELEEAPQTPKPKPLVLSQTTKAAASLSEAGGAGVLLVLLLTLLY